jgi:hypothetical protein
VAQLGARLDGIEEVVGSNPIGSTNFPPTLPLTISIAAIPQTKFVRTRIRYWAGRGWLVKTALPPLVVSVVM